MRDTVYPVNVQGAKIQDFQRQPPLTILLVSFLFFCIHLIQLTDSSLKFLSLIHIFRHPHLKSHCCCCKGIVYHVLSQKRNLYRKARPVMAEYSFASQDSLHPDIFRINIETVAASGISAGHAARRLAGCDPVGYRFFPFYPGERCQHVIVPVAVSYTHLDVYKRQAMSSIRVMATCALLGEAVGKAAAVAVRNGIAPHEVYLEHMKQVQTLLLNEDCFLPSRTRQISEVCRHASLFGADDTIRNGQDRACLLYTSRCV